MLNSWEQIAENLKTFATRKDLVRVIIPRGGLSMIAKAGGPYHNEIAGEALFIALTRALEGGGIEVVDDKRDINDRNLALNMATTLIELMQKADCQS